MKAKETILVVDDSKENIDTLTELLFQFDVVAETDGGKALEKLFRKPVDLILLDITMPGMDGFQVCKRIKGTSGLKHIPVIFLTGRTATADIVHGFEVGGVDYITKPFKSPELLARIKTHIELKKAREEIKSLRGIIPICASCKKIRDDKGYWNQLESYIRKHSDADFTHSLCPDCMRKLYPEESSPAHED